MKTSILTVIAGALFSCLATLQGAVVLDNQQAYTLGDDPADTSFTVGADANFLLLNISFYSNSSGSNQLSDITYGGASLTRVVNQEYGTSRHWQNIWVLEDPGTGSNTLSFTEGSDDRLFSVNAMSFEDVASYTLHGTESPDNGAGNNFSSATYTSTGSGSAMLAAITARQNYSDENLTGVTSYSDFATQSLSQAQVGYDLNVAAGTDFQYTANVYNGNFASIELIAVPEPSAFVLTLGALGLLLVFRRRR